MRKFLKFILKTVKWSFIVFCVFIFSLFFREQTVPQFAVNQILERVVGTNLVVSVDSVAVGFVTGVRIEGVRIYDRAEESLEPTLAVESCVIRPLLRRVQARGVSYMKLPRSYYLPENHERNERIRGELPRLEPIDVELEESNILGIAPKKLTARVRIADNAFFAEDVRIIWPDREVQMKLDGYCTVDLKAQEIIGEVKGTAKQRHIRPLLVTLDLDSALPYMDAFTEVEGPVPAKCAWRVNLINSDLDLDLDLHPKLGKYNLVPMSRADGRIALHVYTRGNSLNYRNTIGPIEAKGPNGEPLEGTVTIEGVNGTNMVTVVAKSELPVAQILKIGGFEGHYVDDSVVGKASGDIFFHFPRSMGENLSLMSGGGRLVIRDGQLMRMEGFKGLLALLAEHVPGVSWFTDSTQASADYVIEDGVLRTDNLYIEGSVFSIKMFGAFDFVHDSLNFTARVQFSKKDSVLGKVLHPLTWPFTKLLLEFRLTGSSENPSWRYITVVDRVLEIME